LGDVGFNGGTAIRTPHLDDMAKAGLKSGPLVGTHCRSHWCRFAVAMAPKAVSCHPLLRLFCGRKWSLYEGACGVRVLGLIEWPAEIAPGETDSTACTCDHFSTFREQE